MCFVYFRVDIDVAAEGGGCVRRGAVAARGRRGHMVVSEVDRGDGRTTPGSADPAAEAVAVALPAFTTTVPMVLLAPAVLPVILTVPAVLPAPLLATAVLPAQPLVTAVVTAPQPAPAVLLAPALPPVLQPFFIVPGGPGQ
ncbi:hypothetical protein J6590_089234 [Homalodisca vitripennis]|nr:hypothetical protein J6590_089234 [Homalodisca vitripennis]